MESSLYKNFVTSRGIKYHYYYSAPVSAKPVVLFVHGFPCTSADWRKQATFFKEKGYGLVVPDLLGYGGTDKPADTAAYQMSKMSTDLIEILENEKVEKVIAVGHDWGSVVTSRIANYYQDRFLGFAYVAVGYTPPQPDLVLDQFIAFMKQLVGYETAGYYKFFASDDGPQLVEDHFESFLSLIYTSDPTLWVQNFGNAEGLRSWLEADKKSAVAPYFTKEDAEYANITKKNGFAAPTRWYKLFTEGFFAEDDKQIPMEKYLVQKPVFFAGCQRDPICLAAPVVATIGQACPNHTVHVFDADHWLPVSLPDEFNAKLLGWVESISV